MVRKNRIIAGLLAGVMALSLLAVPEKMRHVEAAEASTILDTDVDAPRSGNIIIEVPGRMRKQDVQAAVDRINEIRKEACDERLAYPNDGNGTQLSTRLTPSDYVPVVWSLGLEKWAIIRAAEYSIHSGHVRPNSLGQYSYSMPTINGTKIWLENLAANSYSGTTLVTAINQWYGEKNLYVNNSSGYGHYQLMINPKITCFGMGLFNNPLGRYENYVAGEFAHSFGEKDMSLSFKYDGSYIQLVEISNSYVKDIKVKGQSVCNVGDTQDFSATVATSLDGNIEAKVNSGITWTSSDSSVASIDSSTGEMTALSPGETVITAKLTSGTLKKEYKVVVLETGVTIEGVINPEMITVDYNTRPDIPETVPVRLSNGKTMDLGVAWEDYDATKLMTDTDSVEFDVNGTILDMKCVQRIHVNPAKILEWNFSTQTITTNSGTRPSYPYNATVYLENRWSYTAAITWDTNTYYKNRAGGTYTVNGTAKFGYDGTTVTYPVSVNLVVNPATVNSVTATKTEVVTTSGTEPVYPKATVVWSNGDKTTEAVEWNKDTDFATGYKRREGGNYTITGRYYDEINDMYIDDYPVSVNVKVEKAYITEIEYDNSTINVLNGEKPVLPSKATVHWSNGEVDIDRMILWDTIPEENYNNMTGGSYTASGTVDGATVSVNYIVAAPSIVSLGELSTVNVLEGKIPVLPKKVTINWNNGRQTSEDVEWPVLSVADFSTPFNTVTIRGSIKGRADTSDKVVVKVYVGPKSLTGLSWKAQDGTSTTVSTAQGTVFYDNYDWSKISGELIASYSNETSEVIDINDIRIERSNYDEESVETSQRVKLSYSFNNGEQVTTKSVYLNLILHLPEYMKVTPPDKTEYIQGQRLDKAGFNIITVYDDGFEKLSYEAEEETIFKSNVVGEQTIYVTCDRLTGFYKVKVIPKVPTKITVSDINPQKIDKELNVADAEISVSYNDDEIKTKKLSTAIKSGDVNVIGYDKSRLGKQIITISYDEIDNPYDNPLTVRKTIDVKDKILVGLELASYPKKTEYIEGQDLELDGAKVEYLYDNDTTEIVDVTSAIISGYDKNRIGDQEITVSKDGFADAFVVNVRAKKIVKRYLVEPTRTKYLEGDALDLTGGYIYTSYDNGTEDEISLSDSRVVVKLYASGFFLDEIPEVDMSKMPEGYHALDVRLSGISIMNEKGYFPEIEVKAPVRGADLAPAEGTVTSFPAGTNDETLVNAMEGATVSVPCADGTTSSLVITKDMIAGVETVEGDDSDVIIKKIKVKVGEKTGSDGEEIIDPETGLVDNGIYAYIEVQVARPETPKPDAPGNTTPSNPDDSSSGNSGNVTPSNPESGENTGVSSEDSTSGSNEAKYEVDSDGVKYLVLSEMKASDIKTNVSVSDKKSQGKYKISKVTKKNGKIIGGTVIYMKPYNKNCKTANIKASIKLAGVTFKVTSINKNAFKNSKKLTKVTIGSNISKIGKSAFYGCKKLKTITFKTSKLKSKSIGSKAFKGIYKKAVIKVPKKKLKSYKTYFKKAGAPKTSKIKK